MCWMGFYIFSAYWLQCVWTNKMTSLIDSKARLWLWCSSFFNYIATFVFIFSQSTQNKVFHWIFHFILLNSYASFQRFFFSWFSFLCSWKFIIFMRLILICHLRKCRLLWSYRKWIIIVFVFVYFSFFWQGFELINSFTLFLLLLSNCLFCKL